MELTLNLHGTYTHTHPQRAIDELSLMEAATADSRPAYLLEQLPEMREALCRGVVWAKVAKGARETVLNDSQAARRVSDRRLPVLPCWSALPFVRRH